MAFALLAMLQALVITHVVFRSVPITTDEHSYVFQAFLFHDGLLKRPYPLFADQLNSTMVVADPTRGWFSRYPPGHPLWLVPGTWVDNPRVMIWLAAAFSVMVMMAIGQQLGVPLLCIPVLLCVSPYFVFMHGTLLSHTSGFLAAALMLWAYLTWRQTGKPLFAALAGLAWSWFFLNRTYTALLVAVPFGVAALLVAALQRKRRVIIGTACFALCALAGIAVYLAYNKVLTGDPFLPPYLFYQPGEALGFGPRSEYGNYFIEHTFRRGLCAMWSNLKLLDLWIFGVRGSLVGLLILAVIGWTRQTALLLSAAVVVWFGYVFFYFRGIRTVGPVYYFETLPFLIVAAALGIKRVWALLERRRALRSGIALACLVMLLGTAVAHAYVEGSKIRQRNHYSRRILNTIKTAPDHALVFLDGICRRPYMEETVFNPNGVASDPLLAYSSGPANTVLRRYFSDRKAFIIRRGAEDTLEPVATDVLLVENLRTRIMHHQTGMPMFYDHGRTVVWVADEANDRAGYLSFGIRKWVAPGRYEVVFDLVTSGATAAAPIRLDVVTNMGRMVLGTRDVTGPHNGLVTVAFKAEDYEQVEPRVWFGGTGKLEVKYVRISEVPDA